MASTEPNSARTGAADMPPRCIFRPTACNRAEFASALLQKSDGRAAANAAIVRNYLRNGGMLSR